MEIHGPFLLAFFGAGRPIWTAFGQHFGQLEDFVGCVCRTIVIQKSSNVVKTSSKRHPKVVQRCPSRPNVHPTVVQQCPKVVQIMSSCCPTASKCCPIVVQLLSNCCTLWSNCCPIVVQRRPKVVQLVVFWRHNSGINCVLLSVFLCYLTGLRDV